MIHLKAITDTLPFDVKEDYLVLREAINDCIEAITELQNLEKEQKLDNLAKSNPWHTLEDIEEITGKEEPRYTIQELQEKYDTMMRRNRRPVRENGDINYFLDWIERDSKKGR